MPTEEVINRLRVLNERRREINYELEQYAGDTDYTKDLTEEKKAVMAEIKQLGG